MAQANPFTSFFQGLGTGMQSGRDRETALRKASRGEISQDEVPGKWETVLTAMSRASTPADTLIAQDRLKLEAASLALRKSIHDDEYKLREQNQFLDEVEYLNTLQQSINDNRALRQATIDLQSLMNEGDIDGVRGYQLPEGISSQGQEAVLKVKSDLIKGEQFKRLDEIQAMKARLNELGVIPQDYENLSYMGLKDYLDKLTNMQTWDAAQQLVDEGGASSVTVTNNRLTPTWRKKADPKVIAGMDEEQFHRAARSANEEYAKYVQNYPTTKDGTVLDPESEAFLYWKAGKETLLANLRVYENIARENPSLQKHIPWIDFSKAPTRTPTSTALPGGGGINYDDFRKRLGKLNQ